MKQPTARNSNRGTVARRTFCAGLTGLSAAVIAAPARAATFSWKIGSDQAADNPISVRVVEAAGKIRAETNGAVDIKLFPNSSLGGDPQMLAQLRLGALEMLVYAGGILDSVVPLAPIENVAYAFKDRPTVFAAMDGELGAAVRGQIAAKGMVAFDKVWENGYRELTTSTKPIRTVADLAGLKLRVAPGKMRIDMFASLDASPTPISAAELYTALQTKIVEGQENPLVFIESQRYFEVQKYLSLSNHMWSGNWTLVNSDHWKSMPPALQAVVRKHFDAAVLLQRRDNANMTSSLRDKLARQGLTFNDVATDGFRTKLQTSGYYGRWRDEFGPANWTILEKYAGKLA